MNKKNLLLSAAAGLLILSAAVDNAWAYFTTYAEALGGRTINLGDVTEIEESISNWTKHVTITSEEDSEPVYIRARAFASSEYTLTYSNEEGWSEDSEGGWHDGGDGYWYYNGILNGGEKTKGQLLIKIDGIPEDAKTGDDFNVVVIYETTPVLYKEDGTPYADWKAKVNKDGIKTEDNTQEKEDADGE